MSVQLTSRHLNSAAALGAGHRVAGKQMASRFHVTSIILGRGVELAHYDANDLHDTYTMAWQKADDEAEAEATEAPSVTADPVAASLLRGMVAAADATTDELIESYKAQLTDWQASYADLWKRIDRAAERMTTRDIENVLGSTAWRMVAALEHGDSA